MSNVHKTQIQFVQARMSWRIHAGVAAFVLLLTVVIPVLLARTVGFGGYANYLMFVLVPSLLAGTLLIEGLFPRFVNAYALRRTGSDGTPEILRTASKVAWVSDLFLRGIVSLLVLAALAFLHAPAFVQRIGLTVVVIMAFFGLLNLIVGPRLAREVDAGGTNLDRQISHAEIERAAVEGIRPREWDASLVQRCIVPPDESIWEVRGLLLAYYYALDSGRIEEAETFIRRATEISQPTHAPWSADVWHEAAFVAARFHGNAEVARGCLRFLRRSKGTTEAHTRHRVDAAVCLAEGNLEEARRLVCKGCESIAMTNNPAIAQLDTDLLRGMQAEVDTQRSPSEA